LNPDSSDLHNLLETSDRPLNSLTKAELCPGTDILDHINADLR